MNDNRKFIIDSSRLPVDWNRQLVDINEAIHRQRTKISPIHRWVEITALIIFCIIGSVFLKDHSNHIYSETWLTQEDLIEYIYLPEESTLPESLLVLNDIDNDETDYDDLMEYITP